MNRKPVAIGQHRVSIVVDTGAVVGPGDAEEFREAQGVGQILAIRHAPEFPGLPIRAAIRERMRQLTGRWKATPFGETMELRFG